MVWNILRTAVTNWFGHRSPRQGAALAYYSVFSIGPLLLIVTAVAGLFCGTDAVSTSISAQFTSLLGEEGGAVIDSLLEGAAGIGEGTVAIIVGVALLVLAAVGIVAQLRDAMNTIWEVKDPPSANVEWYVRTYAVSLAGVLALGLLLATSLVLSAAVAGLSSWGGEAAETSVLWQILQSVASLAMLTVLFAMVFKWLPEAKVTWWDALRGGIITAVLFELGKVAIAWYVAWAALESSYGAAGSLVVLLIWVYYSAQIVLFGAELAHALAQHTGHATTAVQPAVGRGVARAETGPREYRKPRASNAQPPALAITEHRQAIGPSLDHPPPSPPRRRPLGVAR